MAFWSGKRQSEEDASRERFERLVLPHLDAAYNLARWLTRDNDAACDIVQEASLRAFRFRDNLRGEDARPWLLAIVRNTFLTWWRATQRAAASHEEYDDDLHGEASETLDAWTQRPSSPEATLVAQSERQRIHACLERLPLAYREVIVLRDLEELAYKEIARVLDIPTGTVMSRLARGRKLLGKFLREGGEEK
jgi:RNA polymerase sigma-70 factor (ECF subfamily)